MNLLKNGSNSAFWRRTDRSSHILIGVISFVAFFWYFAVMDPIMIGDADDWTYIAYLRQAIPHWGGWNPTKILPEILTGICGYFAAYVVYPICGDYLYAVTYVFAFVLSLVISIYIVAFYQLTAAFVPNKTDIHWFSTAVFVALHFGFFKVWSSNNAMMFNAPSLSRITFYTVPMLLVETAVMVLLRNYMEVKKNGRSLFSGPWIAAIYLLAFSNMCVNVMFVLMCSFLALVEFIKRDRKSTAKEFIAANIFYLLTMVLYGVSYVFELFGGRAQSLEFNLTSQIQETIFDLKTIYSLICWPYFFLCSAIVLAAMIILFVERKKEDPSSNKLKRILAWFLFAQPLCILYMLLLFTRVGGHKLARIDNISVMWFGCGLFSVLCLAYILSKFEKSRKLIPLAMIVALCSIFNANTLAGNTWFEGGDLYQGVHNGYESPKECYEANTDMIKQFLAADEAGADELVLYAPDIISQYSWGGERIAKTLYRHGIVQHLMKVVTVPLSEKPAIEPGQPAAEGGISTWNS